MAKRYFACVAVLAVLALGACDDAPETGRTIMSVDNFNGGMPVQSDVVFDDGTDNYIPEDIILATFSGRFYNKFITGTNHSQILIESYNIVWTRTDGGSGTLAPRTENSAIYVTVGDETDASIRLTTWADKTGPVLAPLVGTSNQVAMRADITFAAREVGTEEEIEFAISVGVNFADIVNSN